MSEFSASRDSTGFVLAAAERIGAATARVVINSVQTIRNSDTPDAWAASTGAAHGLSPMRPLLRKSRQINRIDATLLDRAAELLEGIETLDAESLELTLESLRCVLCELWISTANTTQYHQSILAIVESFLKTQETIDGGQAAALRGAINDLGTTVIGESHVDVIRSQFLHQGYKPLAILDDLEPDVD